MPFCSLSAAITAGRSLASLAGEHTGKTTPYCQFYVVVANELRVPPVDKLPIRVLLTRLAQE